ncbi:YdbL family protein [Sphingomonas sinipercae]|uniref:YdbL family protein n=1 Tax=Sphingomonas sinipercae TaxID=2714944 RepID=A0A6G7ZP33_9SPHN|nr:YdbL family protein [Sphingomonas sinipercae]QIL02757.1 YdbL family protein [Sphingomonas sinipercae]
MMRPLSALLLAIAVAAPLPAGAQNMSVLNAARQAGQVGERYDGYMGIVSPVPDSVRRQVGAINIKRRNIYIGLGTRRGVAAQVAGIATGCELLTRVQVGEFYMLAHGAWRRRAPGQTVPLPSYCGN